MAGYSNPCWFEHSQKTTANLLCLPKVIVAGVTKAGTTELFQLLQKHPMIVPANVKELFYWPGRWHFQKKYNNSKYCAISFQIHDNAKIRLALVLE